MRNYTWKFWRLLLKYLFKQWGCFSISKSGSSSSRPLLLFFDMCLHWMLNDIHFVQIPAISILRVPSFCSSSSQANGRTFRRGKTNQNSFPSLFGWKKEQREVYLFCHQLFFFSWKLFWGSICSMVWPYAMISVTYCRCHYRVFSMPAAFFFCLSSRTSMG